MNNVKRIAIECLLILGMFFVIRGVLPKNPISEDVDNYLSLKKSIAALPYCECVGSTNLNLKATYWCIAHPWININGKSRSEGETVSGFKIISITAAHTVFLCPEGHVLELDRPSGDDLWGSDIIGDELIGDVPIDRSMEVKSEPQSIESPIEFSAIFWNPTNIVVTTVDGEKYSPGDVVNGFTIIENKIWFTDPMGDTAVTPFYDPSYYRKSKQASEGESGDAADPANH